ncbi:hypothetical protein FQR65_LT15734 [Abscondita terminalis]|nr:hypothetical protein FQR65_LT15734 [Abscondita terminalis]
MESVNEIVERVLRSPQLRDSLQTTIRSITINQSPEQEQRHNLQHEINSSSSVSQELHRLFPSIRSGHLNNSATTQRTSSKRKKSLSYVDVFSLAFSNAQFNVNWSQDDIYNYVKELFRPHLDDTPFELMVPMNRRLIKISLPKGENLNGKSMKQIFRQKVVYVRTLHEIVRDESETTLTEEDHTLNHDIPTSVSPNDISNIINDYIEEQFQHDTEIAITESLAMDKDTSLKDILTRIRGHLKDTISQFNIYREDIFNCCVRAMRRKTFNEYNRISVKFGDVEGNSEGAVDIGGPTREMFRIVVNYIKNSKLFFGSYKKYISLSNDALKNKEYFEAGRLIGLSLIHGGTGPHFFSEKLYSILVFGFSGTQLTIEEIEPDIKGKILKLLEFEDLPSLQEYVNEEPIFSIAGCYRIPNIEEKQKLYINMVEFYAYHRVRSALDQLRDGLEIGRIYNLMKLHPEAFKDVMCCDAIPLTANIIEKLFKPEFSEVGNNDDQTTLKDILVFSTGADTIPPLGFEQDPTLCFLYDDSLFPTANTCGLQLRLPTCHKTYDDFVYYMRFGIGNCNDFAFA